MDKHHMGYLMPAVHCGECKQNMAHDGHRKQVWCTNLHCSRHQQRFYAPLFGVELYPVAQEDGGKGER